MRSTFHCPRWPGCCPDGAVRHDCPALADRDHFVDLTKMVRPDRRDAGNWLDRACEYAVAYPWRICFLILACIAIAGLLERAH